MTRYGAVVPHEYQIDRAKYHLPAGPADPAYTAEKWPLSRGIHHFKVALRAFGPNVADLFAAGVGDPGDLGDRLARVAAGGYLSSLVESLADFDLLESFKQMASDGKLRRVGANGICAVYEDTDLGRAAASGNLQDGLEHYYAGRPELVAKLWWAMLCENSAPFAALHGQIARALQRTSREPSPKP